LQRSILKIISTIALLFGMGGYAVCTAAVDGNSVTIADFESGTSGFTGNVLQDATIAHTGHGSGKMSADFSKGGDPWITASIPLLNSVKITKLSLWVKSKDAAGVTVAFTDSTGQTLQQRPAFPSDGVWHQIILTDFEHGAGMQFFSGANDGKFHWPAKSLSVILEKGPLGGKSAGTLWVDDIDAIAVPYSPPTAFDDIGKPGASVKVVTLADWETDATSIGAPIVKDTTVVHTGKASGRFHADFGKGGDPWSIALLPLNIPGAIKAVRFWYKTTDEQRITVRLDDSTGQTLQQRPALINDGAWHLLTISDFAHGDEMQNYGGANDDVVHWPAKKMGLILEKLSLAGGRSDGTVWIDDFQAATDPGAGPTLTLGQSRLGNVFLTNEPIAIPVETQGDKVDWKLTDFWGATAAHGVANVTAHEAVIKPDLNGRKGYFDVEVNALKAGSSLAEAKTAVAVLSPFDLSTVQNSSFGAMTHFAQNWDTDIIPLAARAGLKNVRDEVYWDQTETSKGQFSFPATAEAYMPLLKANHIDPLVPLTFANPNYDGGQTPYTQEGFDAYARYCVKVLEHYGSQIKTVEIWNEYNGSFANGPAAKDRPDTYVKMLQTAYQAIKKARPDVTVLGVSTAGVPLPYFERVFKAGGLQYMDGISVHPYRYNDTPEGLEQQLARLQALVEKYNNGKPKPIWVTEVGWLTKTDPAPGEVRITEADQANFVVRSYVLMLSAGIVKSYWYLFRDYGDFATMGLIRQSGDPLGKYTPKSSYVAMANMTRQLTDAQFVKTEPTLANVYSLEFKHSSGDVVRTMWSTEPTTLFVKTSGPLTVVDMMGNGKSLTPENGHIRLALTDSPIYVHGTVDALPAPPTGTVKDVVAGSEDDFSYTQGKNNWFYGYFESGATPGAYAPAGFKPFPNYVVTDWQAQWSGTPNFLQITSTLQHPGVDYGHQIWSVRRWTSNLTGTVEIKGRFARLSAQGDGTNGRIFVDGTPVYSQLLGAGNSIVGNFDVKTAVHPGSNIDVSVDPGPGTNLDFDGTSVECAIIRLSAVAH